MIKMNGNDVGEKRTRNDQDDEGTPPLKKRKISHEDSPLIELLEFDDDDEDLLNEDFGIASNNNNEDSSCEEDVSDLDPYVAEMMRESKRSKKLLEKVKEENKENERRRQHFRDIKQAKKEVAEMKQKKKEENLKRQKSIDLDPHRLNYKVKIFRVENDELDDNTSIKTENEKVVKSPTQKRIKSYLKSGNRINSAFSTGSLKTEMRNTNAIINPPMIPKNIQTFSAIQFQRLIGLSRRKDQSYFKTEMINTLFEIMAYSKKKEDVFQACEILHQLTCVGKYCRIGLSRFIEVFIAYGFDLYKIKKIKNENGKTIGRKLIKRNVKYYQNLYSHKYEIIIVRHNLKYVFKILNTMLKTDPKRYIYFKEKNYKLIYYLSCSIAADPTLFKPFITTTLKILFTLNMYQHSNIDITSLSKSNRNILLSKPWEGINYEEYSSMMPLKTQDGVLVSNILPLKRQHIVNERAKKIKYKILSGLVKEFCKLNKVNIYNREELLKEAMGYLNNQMQRAHNKFKNPKNQTSMVNGRMVVGDRHESVVMLDRLYWVLDVICDCFFQVENNLIYSQNIFDFVGTTIRKMEVHLKAFPKYQEVVGRMKEKLSFTGVAWLHFNRQLDYMNEKFNGKNSYKTR